MDRIVVGVDGSAHGTEALRWASEVVGVTGGRLELVTAVLPPVAMDSMFGAWVFDQSPDEEVERLQSDVARQVGLEPASLTLSRLHGAPGPTLLEAAAGADLLVLGTHGHGVARGALVGSVTHQLAGHTPCPMVAVPDKAAPPGRIVVGVDGSESALRALRWVAPFARAHDATVEVVGVFDRMTSPIGAPWMPPLPVSDTSGVERQLAAVVADTVDRAGLDGVPVETSVLEGPASVRLRDRARDAELLVVGSRGRGGFRALVLGSTAHGCLTHPPCPVVVVPGV